MCVCVCVCVFVCVREREGRKEKINLLFRFVSGNDRRAEGLVYQSDKGAKTLSK